MFRHPVPTSVAVDPSAGRAAGRAVDDPSGRPPDGSSIQSPIERPATAPRSSARRWLVALVALGALVVLAGCQRMENAADVAAGDGHTCVVTTDGTVECTGSGELGQLGDRSQGSSTAPVTVQDEDGALTGATDVAVGGDHSCAVRSGGEVVCWGAGQAGQLGIGSTTEAQTVAVPVSGEPLTATAVTAGAAHTCASAVDGRVRCWGANDAGQLGNFPTSEPQLTPVEVPNTTTAAAIAAGDHHTCMLTGDGSVQCWGANEAGQVGSGSTSPAELLPVQVPGVAGAVAIAAGRSHTCAVTGDGSVWCWGANEAGQVGSGSTSTSELAPVEVDGLEPVVAVAAGGATTCARSGSGSVWCWGANGQGQVGSGAISGPVTEPTQVQALGSATAVAVGSTHACAVGGDGRARCWGDDTTGALGIGEPGGGAEATPRAVRGPLSYLIGAVDEVSLSSATSCGRLADRTIGCWGLNTSNQAGIPGGSQTLPTPLPTPGIDDAVAIGAGNSHTCALRPDGTVWCWGSNNNGRLGRGTVGGGFVVPAPVVDLDDVVQLSVGGEFSCAVREGLGDNGVLERTVWCWGRNLNGQVGAPPAEGDAATPVQVGELTTAVEVQAGTEHACARLADGTLRCWGNNNVGQLGNGGGGGGGSVQQVTGIDSAVGLSTANRHACALLADTTVRCWGAGSNGQLGNGSSVASSTPVVVTGLSGVVDVSAGGVVSSGHSCALLGDGTVRCWGNNTQDQLGNGTGVNSPLPVTVQDVADVVSVHSGGSHNCGVTATGSVRCWGAGVHGQLGDGVQGTGYTQAMPRWLVFTR